MPAVTIACLSENESVEPIERMVFQSFSSMASSPSSVGSSMKDDDDTEEVDGWNDSKSLGEEDGEVANLFRGVLGGDILFERPE